MLADGNRVAAQRRDPPGVKTFDEGDIITSDPDRMRALQTQFRLADTRIMDYLRDSTLAIQQGHRNGFQHFAVWFRNREHAKESSSEKIAKSIAKELFSKGLELIFPESTPFVEAVKFIAKNSMDAADKLLTVPPHDVNLFLEKLRTAEEEYIRQLLDTPAQFRKDHAAELQAAKMAYLDAWMQDETHGPQGQELPESVRQMLDALGVPKPGAETAQRVAEGVLTSHIHTIYANDEMFRMGAGPYSYWDLATVSALRQMDLKGNTERICEVERRFNAFFRSIPQKECDAAAHP
jgi:hypothetical protein